MTTTAQLQELADGLTELMPPPPMTGANSRAIGAGRWVIAPIGGGAFALRIEYPTRDGETVIVRAEREISGFSNALRQSLEFMLSVHTATRHSWLPV